MLHMSWNLNHCRTRSLCLSEQNYFNDHSWGHFNTMFKPLTLSVWHISDVWGTKLDIETKTEGTVNKRRKIVDVLALKWWRWRGNAEKAINNVVDNIYTNIIKNSNDKTWEILFSIPFKAHSQSISRRGNYETQRLVLTASFARTFAKHLVGHVALCCITL